jgi:HEAT repeat protein
VRLLPLLLLALAAAADEERQVDWVADWDKAFALAKETNRPVMVCINSKDGEKASDATAKEIYRDPEFVALSRSFVMVVVSTLSHSTVGPCSRFGRVACADHLACWKALASAHGDKMATAFAQGEMITPQHVWFAPDGTLFRRKEYWIDKAELLERMRRALEDASKPKEEVGPGEEAPAGTPPAETPLSASERADLARAEGPDREARRAALGNLLSTEKPQVRAAIIELLSRVADPAVKCDAMRSLGLAQVADARPIIEEQLEHKDALVRSFAAVALEHLARVESVPALLKRAKSEREAVARKNACRALGACGGPAADETAAAALLKLVSNDKQAMIRKHAALALRAYASEKAKALVGPKLEQAAQKTKDRNVRGGIVYTLAYVGKRETTEPIFKQLLEDAHDEYAKAFLREALKIVRGESGDFGRAAWFLFWEDREDPARSDGTGGG